MEGENIMKYKVGALVTGMIYDEFEAERVKNRQKK